MNRGLERLNNDTLILNWGCNISRFDEWVKEGKQFFLDNQERIIEINSKNGIKNLSLRLFEFNGFNEVFTLDYVKQDYFEHFAYELYLKHIDKNRQL